MDDDLNQMQFCRRWAQHARAQTDEDPALVVTGRAAAMLGRGMMTLFSMTDTAWELVAKRKLTTEEKWGKDEDHDRCPDCGQPVPDIFDHVADDCTGVAYSDSVYRIKECIKSLEAGHPALPVGFAQLAYDLRIVIRHPK